MQQRIARDTELRTEDMNVPSPMGGAIEEVGLLRAHRKGYKHRHDCYGKRGFVRLKDSLGLEERRWRRCGMSLEERV